MPRRLHVAVTTIPGYGHVVPVLGTVAELVRRGHRVTFATSEAFAPLVSATGASVATYDFPAATAGHQFSSHDAWEALCGIPASAAPLAGLLNAARDQAPDIIAFDSTMWVTGRSLTELWQCPALQLSACFASNEKFSLVARMTGADRDDPEREGAEREGAEPGGAHPGTAHHVAGESGTADQVAALAEFRAELVTFLGDLGLPDRAADTILFGPEEFKLVFVPRAFQYAGESFGDGHAFVGPCVADRPSWGAWAPPPDGREIVLISLGTSAYNCRPEFFRDCAQAFAGLPWHVVITLGGGVRAAHLGPLPANVEARDFVPHPIVLEHAAAFVTAAGMGSVMESLHSGTPLVMVPQHREQVINAERVAELGLGRILADVSATTVRDAVVAVSSDDAMACRLAAMRREFQEAGGARAAADYLEAHAG
jgi:MGT family glycosyltransferase